MKCKVIILTAALALVLCGCQAKEEGNNTTDSYIMEEGRITPEEGAFSEAEQEAAMNHPENAPIEDAEKLEASESKVVYRSAQYELLQGGTASMTVEERQGKLNADMILKFDGSDKDMEAAVANQVVDEAFGFNSVHLTIESGGSETYIYLYDLENDFSIEETESAEKYGDFLGTYGEGTSVSEKTIHKIEAFIKDAKDYLHIEETSASFES